MVKICEHTLNENGDSTVVARCSFAQRNDAVSYMNILTRVLRPDAGYEGEQDYWWVRSQQGLTRYTIQA